MAKKLGISEFKVRKVGFIGRKETINEYLYINIKLSR
jgi:hypothetical protein